MFTIAELLVRCEVVAARADWATRYLVECRDSNGRMPAVNSSLTFVA